MSASLHERAGALLLQALDLPPDQRPAFVRRACGGDAELRAEVASLLAASDEAAPLFDTPGQGLARVLAGDDDERLVGRQFGTYRITRRIASGGMGVVYEAEQDSPRRAVALKVMRRGLSNRSAMRRFQFEAQALGRLRHAGIAQVYDAGVQVEDGARIPYFAMEYIAGGASITAYAAAERLSTRQRLELLALVCDAVHHGHQVGIVHRDLKPDNVLVDAGGQPKVIDFGVARATEPDVQLTTVLTGAERLVGTVPYMSPEQASGRAAAVDIRADVYALGVLLYELLSGRLPIDVRAQPLMDAVRAIATAEPRKLGSLDRTLRGDLETIAAKALEKEPARRYQSAAELAADIRRYLDDEPIAARPPTAWYQLRKFARRHRGLVGGGLIGAAALLGGAAIAINQAFVATRARNVARQEQVGAQYQTYLASVAAAAAALDNHDVLLARRSLERAPEHLRGWEWRHLHSRLDQSLAVIPADERPPGDRVRFLEAGVVGAWDARSRRWVRWDARTARRLPDSAPTPYFERNGDATGLFSVDQDIITIRDLPAGRTHTVDPAQLGVPRTEAWWHVRLSRNRRYLLVSDIKKLALVDRATGETFATSFDARGSGSAATAVSDSGAVAISTGLAGRPALWHAGSDQLTPLSEASALGTCVAFSPDGTRLAVGMRDATLGLWDVATGAQLAVGRGHTNALTGVRFTPDGARILSVSADRTLRIWDAMALAPLGVLHGHAALIYDVQISPSGALALSIGRGIDRAVRVWDLSTGGDPAVLHGHDDYVYPVAFSPDGRTIASGGWDRLIRLWSADSRVQTAALTGCTSYPVSLSFSPDGRRLLSRSGSPSRLRVWDVATREQIAQLEFEVGVRDAVFHPDGVHVYLPGEGTGPITLWNSTTGQLVQRPFATLAALRTGPVSADGRFAVIRAGDRQMLVRTDDGRTALPDIGVVYQFGPAAAARRLADVDPQARCDIRVWDLDAARQVATLRGHTGRTVFDIAFSPDGKRIATAGDDQVVRVWDAVTFDEIVQLRGHRAYVWSLAFRPDGTQLVTGSGDTTVRVWDTRPLAQRRAAAP